MKLYGKRAGDEHPSELEEVALAITPETLKSLASFLLWTADRMERFGDEFGHEHFSDFRGAPQEHPQFVVAREPDRVP